MRGSPPGDGAPQVFRCFALRPQLSASFAAQQREENGGLSLSEGLELLQSLAAQGRLDAVGEAGFDLYGEEFKAGEIRQNEMFACHLETAIKYDLPMILHVRRAMHKIFPLAPDLKKLPAVVFHSWSGTRGEGEALLRRGINAFFSFGTTVLKNHREAMICAAHFPLDRILFETDAPYQPLRGKTFSSWRDLQQICVSIAALRKGAGSPGAEADELEAQVTANFFRVFNRPSVLPSPSPAGHLLSIVG